MHCQIDFVSKMSKIEKNSINFTCDIVQRVDERDIFVEKLAIGFEWHFSKKCIIPKKYENKSYEHSNPISEIAR